MSKTPVAVHGPRDLIKQNRDVGVELLRIIACFIVVGTHVKLNDLPSFDPNHAINVSRTIIGGFFGEGVTIFFLIMGFFLFRNTSFIKLVKKTIGSIVVPAIIYIVVAQLLSKWIDGRTGLIESIQTSELSLDIFRGILSWNAAKIPLANHLWYLFTYVQIVLWFPVLRYFVGNTERSKRRTCMYIIAMGLISIILRDVQIIVPLGNWHVNWYSIVPSALLIVLIGFELYQLRPHMLGKNKIALFGLLLYIAAHILLTFFQIVMYKRDYNAGHVFSWDSMFAIAGAIGMTLAALSLNVKSVSLQNAIRFIGGNTFTIYLIHMLIINKLGSLGVPAFLLAFFGSSGFGECAYTLFLSFFVFAISLAIAIALRLLKMNFFELIRHLRKYTEACPR